ncbi:Protein Niban Cell growth-inhibiting gene 39 protein FAM129A [Channa argus]|uniref:Protein Niban Cell growth-inhibiting gene 39 protein FAM129A n=1 Tax=Channa argus TaxID=215402 RepID=A0A6G1PJS7_CHAAH|nr:Protein Niban Cell growth-inhibiting gene 39 protein FAM129A [Channa argus]
MGNSASSLLDDNASNFIKAQAEADLQEFSTYFRKQFSVARFSQVQDDLEQHKEKITQLLQQREAPEEAVLLYEGDVFYFDDSRKWKERYVVVRANYSLECHDSLQSFVKGLPPRYKLLPTGGTVLTTEASYMDMVDKCFPDDANVKEDYGPPLSGLPGEYPVYLYLPYRSDSYFCFKQEDKQATFLSILSDCIRHQNQDFLKKITCEVQAFLKAIQLYRQDKGKYEAWDMLIGSDVRVMANLLMEQLLPSLEKDLLPRLKAKKAERKRVWFATVEAAYILVQEHQLEGLSALKEECRTSVQQQEVLMHSDLDQILNSRRQLEEKIRAKVSEPAEKLCSESIQPYLGSVLDELMEPISSGFEDGRQLSENMMEQVCQHFLVGGEYDKVQKALADMARPNLLNCYQKIGSLQEKLQHLQERFGFCNVTGVVHSAQIDLQQLMENAAYTFEQLLHKAVQDHPDNAGPAIQKAKHRVLKQYDYDSSTVRKRIFQDALVSITLPFIKKNLAPICKSELQGLEQFIYADYSNFIHVENVYESVLLQILDKEVTKVMKEAANLKKYNLFTDSKDLVSQSSRSSLSSPSPSISTPGSPAMPLASPPKSSYEPQPPSPLVVNCLKRISQRADVSQEKETSAPKAEEVNQNLKTEKDTSVTLETGDTVNLSETVNVAATPETLVQEEAIFVETAAELEMQSTDVLQDTEKAISEIPTVTENAKTDAEEAAAQTEAPDQTNETVSTTTASQPVASSEGETPCESSEVECEAPPSGEARAATPEEVSLDMMEQKEPVTESDPNSLDVSVGSASPVSDIESTEEVKVTQSSEDEVSTASDVLEHEAYASELPASLDKSTSDQQTEAGSGDVGANCGAAESVNVEASVAAMGNSSSPSSQPSSPADRPPDCIKEIRDLVVEVIEVVEPMQHYPSGEE